jgi:chemotaxis protein CheY-P-specific phosphatase CheC
MGQVAADLTEHASEILVVQALFEDPEQRIEGRFFVLPEMASLEAMLRPAEAGGKSGA